jgi:ribonucleoside-diphosphate reductase beta chain
LLKKPIYNPDSKESSRNRKIIGGNPNGIFELNDIKYQWAYNLYKLMLQNSWFPEEIPLNGDVRDYREKLTSVQKDGFDRALAQLIFMDSLQANNLIDNINPYITAPEVNMCVIRQSFEEILHSHSYAVMLEAFSRNPKEIYDLWKTNDKLRAKNDSIANVYIKLSEEPTTQNIIKAFFANLILEGIYFYSGFLYIYSLGRKGLMLGSSTMIKFIQRDEVTHLSLYTSIIREILKEHEINENEIREMFINAVELEVAWGEYINTGLPNGLLREYIEYLADARLLKVGLNPIYGHLKNPIEWVDDFSKLNEQRANFFESTSTNYSKGGLEFNDTDDSIFNNDWIEI